MGKGIIDRLPCNILELKKKHKSKIHLKLCYVKLKCFSSKRWESWWQRHATKLAFHFNVTTVFLTAD